jgi:hypothetical protein
MKMKGCGNQVVVAKSSKAVGKTFIAARLAACFHIGVLSRNQP